MHDAETVLSIERLPERFVVVGGGPVGGEYASIFAALGVQVTLIDRGTRLLPLLDRELSAALAARLERFGVRLMFGAHLEVVEHDAEGLVVRVDGELLRPEVLLYAVARVANVEARPARAGVQANPAGASASKGTDTAPGIYAAGDITGPPGLASAAMEQARVAMCRAFEIPFKETLDAAVPAGIYTLPETAMVGLTEDAARAAGPDVETGWGVLRRQRRAR